MPGARLSPALRLGLRRLWTAIRIGLPGPGAPYTTAVAGLLVLVAFAMQFNAVAGLDAAHWASTNLVNLRDHPVTAMLASIFVDLDKLHVFAVLFVVSSCVLERWAGRLRAAVIPLAGHVLATLVTEGGVRAAIWHRDLPRADAWQLDTGVSYVAFTAAAAATAYPARRTVRVALVAALGVWTVPALLADPGDMTAWGHVLCVCTGLLLRYWLPDARGAEHQRSHAPAPAVRRHLATTVLGCLAVTGTLLVAGGSRLVPASAPPPRHHAAASCRPHVAARTGCERTLRTGASDHKSPVHAR